jgi:hypothetical protein
MKPLLLLLALSLAANAALYVTRPAASRAAAEPASTSGASAASASAATAPEKPASPHAAFWQSLRPDDPALVARLRAAGWPEDAIRALVTAYVQDHFRARERALFSSSSSPDYWSQSAYSARWSPEARKAQRDLAREKQTLLKSLLGSDLAPEPSFDPRMAGLTPAQAESITMIEEDYAVLTAEIRGDRTLGSTLLLPEDREKLAFLEKEKAADLAKVLSPEQLLDYELKNSPTATSLRYNLTAFNPSEQEFRAIFALQKQLTERLGSPFTDRSASQRDAHTKAQTEIDAQVKQLLSPERYEDYTRAKDYDYRTLYQIAGKLQLRPENALAAYEVKTDIETRARALKPTPGPDTISAYTKARTALAQEAEKRLIEAIGQRGYEAYKANSAFWLKNLATPVTTSAAAR